MRAEAVAVSRERYEGKGPQGRFYQGDTLLLLDELAREYAKEVKLVYMDPPFLTGERFVMRARVGAADWKAGKGSMVLPAFSDAMEPEAYYAMMRRTIEGCHTLLRDDGMLFLHCDFRTSARLRLILDDVFGEGNLLNEIAWVYPVSYTHLQRVHGVGQAGAMDAVVVVLRAFADIMACLLYTSRCV